MRVRPEYLASKFPPGHPRTVSAREDVLLGVLREFLSAYTLSPGAKNGSPNCSPPTPPASRPRTTRRLPPCTSG